MKIYDISQEVFGCEVYTGDPKPEKTVLSSMDEGAVYNLTAFSMCAHNGTHIDAPYHFLPSGKTVDEIPLYKTVGWAYVAEHNGEIDAHSATALIEKARSANPESAKRLLIKGNVTVTAESAQVFVNEGVYLVGNESQTVGPADAPAEVHRILLGQEVVLLEGIRLAEVPEGVYLLSAAPLNLANSDGAPCRAVLVALQQ